jgi:hypothetical protein
MSKIDFLPILEEVKAHCVGGGSLSCRACEYKSMFGSWYCLGEFTPSYILHTRAFGTQGDHSLLYFAYASVQDLFIGGGVIYLAKKL